MKKYWHKLIYNSSKESIIISCFCATVSFLFLMCFSLSEKYIWLFVCSILGIAFSLLLSFYKYKHSIIEKEINNCYKFFQYTSTEINPKSTFHIAINNNIVVVSKEQNDIGLSLSESTLSLTREVAREYKIPYEKMVWVEYNSEKPNKYLAVNLDSDKFEQKNISVFCLLKIDSDYGRCEIKELFLK